MPEVGQKSSQTETALRQPIFRFEHLGRPYQVYFTPRRDENGVLHPDALEVWDTEKCGAETGDMVETPSGKQFTVRGAANYRDSRAYPQYQHLMQAMKREIVGAGIIHTWISDRESSMSQYAQAEYRSLASEAAVNSHARFTARLDEATDRYILQSR